ncbi:MAG TPA: XRE family transcriptional regulator [Bacteroidia bacterium]|nr:XRE family transcriptional regulator [Bacteroidia bacterium]
MKIGSKLKRIRESKRFSQQEIANMLDISQKTYSNIESDKTKPTIPQLSKLSEFLDFDLLELLQKQGITFNQKNEKGSNNGIVNQSFPNELIEQYEERLKDKDAIIKQKYDTISLLKDKISYLENN